MVAEVQANADYLAGSGDWSAVAGFVRKGWGVVGILVGPFFQPLQAVAFKKDLVVVLAEFRNVYLSSVRQH